MVWRNQLAAGALAFVGLMVLLGASGCTSQASVTTQSDAANPTVSAVGAVAAPRIEPTAGPLPTPTALTIPPTPTPLPIESYTLLFSGDVLSHTPVIARALSNGVESGWAYDYRPMFSDILPRVSGADLAICVLETPVSPDNIGLDGYPTFNAPTELPDALIDAGYDGCSTASNHSMDRGPSGVRTTLGEMDRVGLGHAGMARSDIEARAPRVYDVKGVRVAHLSYTYGLNGFVLPQDEPWLVNVNDSAAILAEATRARDSGADIVVLSIQWGNEYQRDPSTEQLQLAQTLTRGGEIDVIIGNHAHVVQPVTQVNGVPVVYGLGNSLSNQSDNCCRTGTQDGVMIEVTIQGNPSIGYDVGGLAFAPTWVDRSTYTIIDLLSALDDPTLDPAVQTVYQTSFDRTVEAIQLLGPDLPLAE